MRRVTAYQEYMAVETDPAKKAKAQHDLAQIMFARSSASADSSDALSVQKDSRRANPEDVDATLRMGQALFEIGALNNKRQGKVSGGRQLSAAFMSTRPPKLTVENRGQGSLTEALKVHRLKCHA